MRSSLKTSHTRIGVIGGIGSRASIATYSLLMEELSKNARDVVIINLPIENIFEFMSDQIMESVYHTIEQLSHVGAKLIGIPCNTIHRHAKTISKKCLNYDVTFVDIIDESVSMILKRDCKVAGIIGTPIGIELYKESLESAGVEVLIPNYKQQEIINEIIRIALTDEFHQSKVHRRIQLEQISADFLSKGADCILLGCTELPLYFENSIPEKYISTIHALVSGLVEHMRNKEDVCA
ncbi:aspartate/glutamate racemase family protein [Billgrantia kenyensis]|uniref:Aspartate/glutamate racemase family protein n=1 Tax=Billgrantia kenyensis TaxID=321266 RepID=A0A7V9W552_9GAMM|nr:aspartate/glutamate racemase family protein [Halomonas kenyensis]MBA2781243.1 aspartate/glutamate racemase family protein [Halomonas kenyensis]MCG6663912.1 aspartate/glutamate racemase family protein [Halomonas kenyensis]